MEMSESGSTLCVSQSLFMVSKSVCFGIYVIPVHFDLTLLTIMPPME